MKKKVIGFLLAVVLAGSFAGIDNVSAESNAECNCEQQVNHNPRLRFTKPIVQCPIESDQGGY